MKPQKAKGLFVLAVTGTAAASIVATGAPARAANATSLNTFLSNYRADVGSSVKLPDGRVLWLFGDTIRADGHWDKNSAVVQNTNGTFTQVSGTFAKPAESDDWYWPGEAYVENSQVRVLMQQYHCNAPCGAWDFAYEQTDIVSFDASTLAKKSTVDLPARFVNGQPVSWSQTFKSGTSARYFYGAYAVTGKTGKAYQVATVANGASSTTKSNWKFQGTKLWPYQELGQVVSLTTKPGGGYRLYSKQLDLMGSNIIRWDGATPSGPWSNKTTVATPATEQGDWTYAVEAHPEQSTSGSSQTVLTYATNGNIDHYHVTAIEVAK